jgi:hypothetical protein
MYSVILERRSEPLAITDLAPSRSSNAYALGTLALGGDVYTDRSYTFTSVGPLAGLPYVRTANDDKNVRGSDALRLRVNQPVTVYVAYDARATARPRWLSGWRQLAFQIDTTDGPRNVFANAFAGGMLALGGNRAPGADSNYSVVIQLQSQRR